MNKLRNLTLCAALAPTVSYAGAIEYSRQGVLPVYEEGTVLRLEAYYTDADISGDQAGLDTGEIIDDTTTFHGSFKMDLAEKLSFALVTDVPVRVNTNYPSNTGAIFQGFKADLDSRDLTAILLYRFNDNWSVHGGVRAQRADLDIRNLPTAFGAYGVNADTDTGYGFLVGAAYEIPDIALRVSLTYNSEVDLDFSGQEGIGGANGPTSFEATLPQSVQLDFQTGVAANTLVFGTLRWREWSAYDVSTPLFGQLDGDYKDSTDWEIGVFQQFNDTWSGAMFVGGSPDDPPVSDLDGTIGHVYLGAGVTYEQDNFDITGSLTYSWLSGGTSPTTGVVFEDSNALTVGLEFGYHF